MKKTTIHKPTRSKLTLLHQLCNLIPNHLVPRLARDTGVDAQAIGSRSESASRRVFMAGNLPACGEVATGKEGGHSPQFLSAGNLELVLHLPRQVRVKV